MKQDTSLTLQHRRQRRPQLDNTLLIPADLCKRVENVISFITEQAEKQMQISCSECEECITVMNAVRNVMDDFVHTSSTPELQTRCIAKLTNMLRASRCNQYLQATVKADKSKNNDIAVTLSSSSATEVGQAESHNESKCATDENTLIISGKEQGCNFNKRFTEILATQWLLPFLLDCRVRYLHRALTSLFKSICVVDECVKTQFRNLFVELLICPLLYSQQEISSELALHFLNSLDGLSSTLMPLIPDAFSSTFTQVLPVLSKVLHWMACNRDTKVYHANNHESKSKAWTVQNAKNNVGGDKASKIEAGVDHINVSRNDFEGDVRGTCRLETNNFVNNSTNIDELRFCIRAVTTYVHRYLDEVRKVWEQTYLEEPLLENEEEYLEEKEKLQEEERVSLCLREQRENRKMFVNEKEVNEYIKENNFNADVTKSVELLLSSGLYMLCNVNLPKDILNAAGLLVASLLTIRTCDHNFIASVCYYTCTFASTCTECSAHNTQVVSKTINNSAASSTFCNSRYTHNVYSELDAIVPVLTQIVCAPNPCNALCSLHEDDKGKLFSVFASLLTKVGRFALIKGIMSHLLTPIHEEAQNTCVLLRQSVIDVKVMSQDRMLHKHECQKGSKSVNEDKESMQAQKEHLCVSNSIESKTCCCCVTLLDIIIPSALDYCDALQEPEVRFMAIQTLDGAIRYLSSTFSFALKMFSAKSKETRFYFTQQKRQPEQKSQEQCNWCKQEELSSYMLELQVILSECYASWNTMYNVINKITEIVIELWDDGTQQVSGALYSTYSEILHVHQVILELNKVMYTFNNKEMEANCSKLISGDWKKDESNNAHFDIEYTLRHVCEMHDDRRGKYHALLGLMKIMPLDRFLQCVSWYYSTADNKYIENTSEDNQLLIIDNSNCEIKDGADNMCLHKSKHLLEELNTNTCNVNMTGLQNFVYMLLSSASNHKTCSIAGEMFVTLITQLNALRFLPTVCTSTCNKNQNSNNSKTHSIADESELFNILEIQSIGLMQPLCDVLLRHDTFIKGSLSICNGADSNYNLMDSVESQARISHIIVHFIVPLIKENKSFLNELLLKLLTPLPTTLSTRASPSFHHEHAKTETETNKIMSSESIDYCVVELLFRARSCGIDTAAYIHPSSFVFAIIKRSIHNLSFDLSLSALSLYTLGSRKVRCVSKEQCAAMEQYIALHLHLGGDTAAQRAITEVYKKWLKRIQESLSTCYKPKIENGRKKKSGSDDKKKRTDDSDVHDTNATLKKDILEVSVNIDIVASVKDAIHNEKINLFVEDNNSIITESQWEEYMLVLSTHFANMVQVFMENIGVSREAHDGLSVERRVLAISLYTLTLNTLLQSSLLPQQTTLHIKEEQKQQEEDYASLYQYFPECLIEVLLEDLHNGWSYCRHVAFDLLTLYCKIVPAFVLRALCKEMPEEEKEEEQQKARQIATINMCDNFHGEGGVTTHYANDNACVQCNIVKRKIKMCKSKVQSAKTYRCAEGAVAETTLLFTYFAYTTPATAAMSTRKCDNRLLELQHELYETEGEINARCAQMQSLQNLTEIFTYINDHPLHGLVSLSTSLLSLLFTLRDKENGNNVRKNINTQIKADNTQLYNDNPTSNDSKETEDSKSKTNILFNKESNTFLRMCCNVIETCVAFIGTESTPCLPQKTCISVCESENEESSSAKETAKTMTMVVVVDCRGHVYDKENPLQESVMRGVVNNTWLAIRTSTAAIERVIQLSDMTKLEFTVVERVCEVLLNSLLVTKHNGVMRCVRSSLKVLCTALMRCDCTHARLHALPEMLLVKLLGVNGVKSTDRNRMLRRSQGLPHAIVAILQSETTEVSSKLFTYCMTSLLRIAQSWHTTLSNTQYTQSQTLKVDSLELVNQEERCENLHTEPYENERRKSALSSMETVNESACANALNVLKFIFEDKTFVNRVMLYLEEAFTTSCDGFGHRSWYIRNSSLMLFSAVLQRFICQPSNQDTNTTSSSNTSLYDIHKRTPHGLSFCYHQLYRYNQEILLNNVNKASSKLLSSVSTGAKEYTNEDENSEQVTKSSNDNEDINLTIFPIMQMLCMLSPDPPHRISTAATPSLPSLSSRLPIVTSKLNSINNSANGNVHSEASYKECTKQTPLTGSERHQENGDNTNTTFCNAPNFAHAVLYCAASRNWLIRASSASALSSIVPVNNVVEFISTNISALLEQECSTYKEGKNVNNVTISKSNQKGLVDYLIHEHNRSENYPNKLFNVNYNAVHGVLLELHSFHTRYVGTLHKDRWHRTSNNNSNNLTLTSNVQLIIVKTILSHSSLFMYCAATCPVIMTEFCLLVADVIYFYFNCYRYDEKNARQEAMHEQLDFDNNKISSTGRENESTNAKKKNGVDTADKTATQQSDEMMETLICLILQTATYQFKAASQFNNILQEEQEEQQEQDIMGKEEVQPFAGRKAVIDSIALVLTVVMNVIPFPIHSSNNDTTLKSNEKHTATKTNSVMQSVLSSWKNIIQAQCQALHLKWTNCTHNIISSIIAWLVQSPKWRGRSTELINKRSKIRSVLDANKEQTCQFVDDVHYVLSNFNYYFDCNLVAISSQLLTNVIQLSTSNSELNLEEINVNATTVQMLTSTLEFMMYCIASELATNYASKKGNSSNVATEETRATLHLLARSSCTSEPLINTLLEQLQQSVFSSCDFNSNSNMSNANVAHRLWHNTEVKSAALQYVAYVLVFLSSQEYNYECVGDDNRSEEKKDKWSELCKALDKLMLLLRTCSEPTQPLCLRRAALQSINVLFSHYRTQIASEKIENGSKSTNNNNESSEQFCFCVMSVDQQVWGLLILLRLLFDDVHEIRIKTCETVSHTLLQLYSPEDHTNVMLSLTALLASAVKRTTSIDYAQCHYYLLQQNEQIQEITEDNGGGEENNNNEDEENEDEDDAAGSVLFERESDNMFAEPTMIKYILHKLFPEETDNIHAYQFTQLNFAYDEAKARLGASFMESEQRFLRIK